MKINMGLVDRMLRTLLAVIIGVLYFVDILSGTLGVILIVLAGIFTLTSFFGFCPLYLPFGISTVSKFTLMKKGKSANKK